MQCSNYCDQLHTRRRLSRATENDPITRYPRPFLPVDVRAASTVSATSAEKPHLEVDNMPPSASLSPFGPVSAERRTLSPARPTLLEEAEQSLASSSAAMRWSP